jgi:hypothetical protein
MTVMIQSLQRQEQTKSTTGAGAGKSQLQSIKQIKSQIGQLQKQVTRIQNDIQRIRMAPITSTRTRIKSKSRKQVSFTTPTVKTRSKKVT